MNDSTNKPYDQTRPESILAYAKTLENRSLRMVLRIKSRGAAIVSNASTKGHMGQMVETRFFGLKTSNASEPDFKQAGLELKTTPLKRSAKGRFAAKERLVLNIIDYLSLVGEEFPTSRFYRKNRLLLLLFYLFEKGGNIEDFVFILTAIWGIEMDKDDLLIIKRDWETIKAKVAAGKAHELSGGDTLYLEACTKGANSRSLRRQPRSSIMAKQRAFALKSGFMTRLFERLNLQQQKKKKEEDVVRLVDSKELEQSGSFEETVLARFERYKGRSVDAIADELDVNIASKRKDRFAVLARAMMGVRKKRIEEFEKADIVMKTIRLRPDGLPKEHLSFPAFDFIQLHNEKIWEESELHDRLEMRFLFVVFQFDKEGQLWFKRSMFWTMPAKDLEEHAKKVWEWTIEKVRANNYKEFPKSSEDSVMHVRPHARNKKDTRRTPQGNNEMKQSFWLNDKYVRIIVSK